MYLHIVIFDTCNMNAFYMYRWMRPYISFILQILKQILLQTLKTEIAKWNVWNAARNKDILYNFTNYV